jgi:AhpD family alkylhydroperoxidase
LIGKNRGLPFLPLDFPLILPIPFPDFRLYCAEKYLMSESPSTPTPARDAFEAYRSRMNTRILDSDSRVIKRFYNLDTNAYLPGALDKKTKELMGLCISLGMRCDSCVKYHIGESLAAGATEQELIETFEIALVVGGSIVIPEMRKAFEYMDELLGN